MKKNCLSLFILLLASTLIFNACKKDTDDTTETEEKSNILPVSFKVDIPDAISNENASNTKSLKSMHNDSTVISGDSLYEHLTNFIHIGEEASDIVNDIINSIYSLNIDQPLSTQFQGEDDGRTKNLDITADETFDNAIWDYKLQITDADMESAADGGIALVVFWNNNPIKGIAIINPYYCNYNSNNLWLKSVRYKINYAEGTATNNNYESTMEVTITGFPMAPAYQETWALDKLKMFVGKKGDYIDVYGSSNHPNAMIFTNNTVGYNYSFIASGHSVLDIGTAKLALPPSDSDISDGNTILRNYSIKKVLTDETIAYFEQNYSVTYDSTDVAPYLANAEAPAFFDNNGFVSAKTVPGSNTTEYNAIADRLLALTPLTPLEIKNLSIVLP